MMQKNESRLTVFFEEPFWVAIYERITNQQLEVCKITFGAEPKDYEIYEFLLNHWASLCFSSPVRAEKKKPVGDNPKRRQRAIKKQLKTKGIGTKSQQALKIQHESCKKERKEKNCRQTEEEKQRKYVMRQQKRKEKHKGR